MKLKNALFCTALVGTTALVTATVVSQDTPQAGMDQAMQEKMMELMQPGEHHQKLDKFVGTWNQEIQFWMQPGTEPQTMTGESTYKWVLDKHFLRGDYSGEWNDQSFKGVEYFGYDNFNEEYVSVWLENMSTGIMMSTGEMKDGALHMSGTMDDCMTGRKDVKTRSVTEFPSEGKIVFSMYSTLPDGREYKMMEGEATRKN